MNKQEVINFIEGQLATGDISKDDLTKIIGGNTDVYPKNNSISTNQASSRNIINVLYSIGAIIAIVGVCILVGQNWDEIGVLGRLLVTAGISCLSYILGLTLRNPGHKTLAQVMFTVSAALAPLGAYVVLKEAGIDFSLNNEIIVSSIFTVLFGMALWISRYSILFLITIGFASVVYYSFIIKLLDNSYPGNIIKWATMLLGVAYISISYGYQSLWNADGHQSMKEKKAVQNILYGLGSLAILGSGISIGGIFDLLFIVFIFGAFYGSVYLKSRSMLILGALFLIGHIIKITSKYFVDSIGWPIAIIGVGFLIIGIGYMTYNLSKKYISVGEQGIS